MSRRPLFSDTAKLPYDGRLEEYGLFGSGLNSLQYAARAGVRDKNASRWYFEQATSGGSLYALTVRAIYIDQLVVLLASASSLPPVALPLFFTD